MEHEFYNGISLAIMAVAAVKLLGPKVAKFADDGIDVSNQKILTFRIANFVSYSRKLRRNTVKGAILKSEI